MDRVMTVFLLEFPWTSGFTYEREISPTYSVEHELAAFSRAASRGQFDYMRRELHTAEDLEHWCGRIKNVQNTGERVVWLSGHGHPKGISWREGALVTRKQVKKAFELAPIHGVIVDGCGFAANDDWLPKNPAMQWALAYSKDVYIDNSVFFNRKVLSWLYDRRPDEEDKSPVQLFDLKVQKDWPRERHNRVDFRPLAASLGARFYFRRPGPGGWGVRNFPDAADSTSSA